MFLKRAGQKNNLCGEKIGRLRRAMPGAPSPKAFAGLLQAQGIDLDESAIEQIESGERVVTDIELRAMARALHVTAGELLG